MPRLTIVWVALLVTLLAACGREPAASVPEGSAERSQANAAPTVESSEPFRVGVDLGVTGQGSALGVSARDALRLLEARFNDGGGIPGPDGRRHPLQLVHYDNFGQEAQSAAVARRLIESDRVALLIGAVQPSVAGTLAATATAAGVPFLSLAPLPPSAGGQIGGWVFVIPPSPRLVLATLLEHLQLRGVGRVAWLEEAGPYGEAGRAAFEALVPAKGLQVTGRERLDVEHGDPSDALARLAASRPDAVIVWASAPRAAAVARAARSLGLELPLLFSPSAARSAFVELAGSAADHTRFVGGKLLVRAELPPGDPQQSALDTFATAFTAAYRRAPDPVAGYAWDALQLAALAFQGAGSDRARLREQIEQLRNYAGVTGVFSMAPTEHNGLDARSLAFIEIRGGTYHLTASAEATAPASRP